MATNTMAPVGTTSTPGSQINIQKKKLVSKATPNRGRLVFPSNAPRGAVPPSSSSALSQKLKLSTKKPVAAPGSSKSLQKNSIVLEKPLPMPVLKSQKPVTSTSTTSRPNGLQSQHKTPTDTSLKSQTPVPSTSNSNSNGTSKLRKTKTFPFDNATKHRPLKRGTSLIDYSSSRAVSEPETPQKKGPALPDVDSPYTNLRGNQFSSSRLRELMASNKSSSKPGSSLKRTNLGMGASPQSNSLSSMGASLHRSRQSASLLAMPQQYSLRPTSSRSTLSEDSMTSSPVPQKKAVRSLPTEHIRSPVPLKSPRPITSKNSSDAVPAIKSESAQRSAEDRKRIIDALDKALKLIPDPLDEDVPTAEEESNARKVQFELRTLHRRSHKNPGTITDLVKQARRENLNKILKLKGLEKGLDQSSLSETFHAVPVVKRRSSLRLARTMGSASERSSCRPSRSSFSARVHSLPDLQGLLLDESSSTCMTADASVDDVVAFMKQIPARPPATATATTTSSSTKGSRASLEAIMPDSSKKLVRNKSQDQIEMAALRGLAGNAMLKRRKSLSAASLQNAAKIPASRRLNPEGCPPTSLLKATSLSSRRSMALMIQSANNNNNNIQAYGNKYKRTTPSAA